MWVGVSIQRHHFTANMRAVPPTGGILDTPYLKVWVASPRAYTWTAGVGGMVGDRRTE